MTVSEMIEALQALELPDALVVRDTMRDNPRIYLERGSNWDVTWLRQRKGTMADSQWFGVKDEGTISLHNDEDNFMLAVVI